jgi:hypothetical protein
MKHATKEERLVFVKGDFYVVFLEHGHGYSLSRPFISSAHKSHPQSGSVASGFILSV